VPSRRHYGDYPQIEDGIGMVRTFTIQFESWMKKMGQNGAARRSGKAHKRHGTILTGSIFAPVLAALIDRFNESFDIQLKVVGVENQYFGGDVSVAGLLTGGDFLAARAKVTGDFAIIPRVALKSDEPVMLDGMQFADLQKQFPMPLHAFDSAELNSFLTSFISAR